MAGQALSEEEFYWRTQGATGVRSSVLVESKHINKWGEHYQEWWEMRGWRIFHDLSELLFNWAQVAGRQQRYHSRNLALGLH